jgi:hypothetical protein
VKRAQREPVQVNRGIQAETVTAEVMAVGSGARAFKASPPTSPERDEGGLRILFLASNPQTTLPLDLAEEMRSLENELRAVKFRDKIVLVIGQAVRPDDLVRLLRRDRPTIVHFSGHGSDEVITLRTEIGDLTVPGSVLARVFRGRDIRLVVLNSCFSDAQAIALKDVVGAVIGTTAAVDDEAARRFTAAFYRTLGDGHSIKEAFHDGEDAVAVENSLENVFRAYGDLDDSVIPVAGRSRP